MSTQRAIRVAEYGEPSVLILNNAAPVPVIKEPTDVLIAVAHAGVNPVDTYIRMGISSMQPTLPYTPGADGAGTVLAVGEKCQRVKVGDRVYFTMCTQGAYADKTIVDEKHVHALGDLTTEQGAAIGIPYFTAYRSLFHRVWAKSGETVLVHGASGAVGIACVQIARAYGLTVIGTAGTQEGLELIIAQGCHHVFNHREPDYQDKIMALTEAKGVPVIMEMLGNVNLDADMKMMSNGGRTCVIGSRGEVQVSPRDLMIKETYVTGVILPAATPDQWAEMGTALSKGITDGWLRPVVDTPFPLSKAPDAHIEVIEHKNGTKGKIVLDTSK